MNDTVRDRIAVIQHQRRQNEAERALSVISNRLGEPHHSPIDPALSLRMQSNLYDRLKVIRGSTGLRSATFRTTEAAIDEFIKHTWRLTPVGLCEFYSGARGSGFFTGPFSRAFLMSCLEHGYEGFALVDSSLGAGVLLDEARDDPTRGDFYEVEWW